MCVCIFKKNLITCVWCVCTYVTKQFLQPSYFALDFDDDVAFLRYKIDNREQRKNVDIIGSWFEILYELQTSGNKNLEYIYNLLLFFKRD